MFARDELMLGLGFADRAGAAGEPHTAAGWPRPDSAYADGPASLVRVGPFGAVPGASKLVSVRFLEPVPREDVIVLPLRWEATGVTGGMFPAWDADLTMTPAGAGRTVITLSGAYRPPLGGIGAWADRPALRWVTAATIPGAADRMVPLSPAPRPPPGQLPGHSRGSPPTQTRPTRIAAARAPPPILAAPRGETIKMRCPRAPPSDSPAPAGRAGPAGGSHRRNRCPDPLGPRPSPSRAAASPTCSWTTRPSLRPRVGLQRAGMGIADQRRQTGRRGRGPARRDRRAVPSLQIAPGRALDLDDQDLALVGDSHPSALQCRPAPGHGLVVQEHVGDAAALNGEGRQAADPGAGFADDFPQPGQLARPVLENHCQVRGHRILIVSPRRAAG